MRWVVSEALQTAFGSMHQGERTKGARNVSCNVTYVRYVTDAGSALPDAPEQIRQKGDRSATLAASIIPGRTFVTARTLYIEFLSKDLVRRFGAFFGAFLGANVTRPARPDIGSAGQGICQEMNLRLGSRREFPFVDHL